MPRLRTSRCHFVRVQPAHSYLHQYSYSYDQEGAPDSGLRTPEPTRRGVVDSHVATNFLNHKFCNHSD
eukprot:scaffold330924_cov14-Prasinocladus_malaysianus.AAC.1